jgi:glycosyltransferase involved in cell wall biosynthesis
MKVLYVTDRDLPARRFSGYDLLDDLAPRGIDAKQVVLQKESKNDRVIPLLADRSDEDLQTRLTQVEARNSMNNLLFPWARVLSELQEFQDADLIHYHLIHNHVVSTYDIPWLFGLKASVWTFHDPWVLTGHCVHPLTCKGWLSDCSPCPYLDRYFPLREDRAGQMWKIKQRVFADLDLDVVVASRWMLDMVKRSPLTSHLERVHLIPFGVPEPTKDRTGSKGESRRRLRIPDDDFVVMLRSHYSEPKGLAHVIEAFKQRPPARPTTLLTVDRVGLLNVLRPDYRLVELGWVDEPALSTAFSASDVFLMPSVAESFGLMAVEAMAAGRPVVCFEGTAVADVTSAPACGVAVPHGDARAMRDAVDQLASDPSERHRRGELGRNIAANSFGYERYLDSLESLYAAVIARRRAGMAMATGS